MTRNVLVSPLNTPVKKSEVIHEGYIKGLKKGLAIISEMMQDAKGVADSVYHATCGTMQIYEYEASDNASPVKERKDVFELIKFADPAGFAKGLERNELIVDGSKVETSWYDHNQLIVTYVCDKTGRQVLQDERESVGTRNLFIADVYFNVTKVVENIDNELIAMFGEM